MFDFAALLNECFCIHSSPDSLSYLVDTVYANIYMSDRIHDCLTKPGFERTLWQYTSSMLFALLRPVHTSPNFNTHQSAT